MRRTIDVALVLIVVLGLTVAACGSGDGGPAADEPVETSIPADAGEARYPADQVVWQARTTGGLVPQVAWAAQRPSLTIYGDGRFFVAAPGLDRRFDQPIELRRGTVDREDLAIFVAQAEASGLFEADVELGSPDVPDMASTAVHLHGGGDAIEISAYALGGRFDTDLSSESVRNRETLRRLLSAGEGLVAQPDRWSPTRVRVLHLPDDATFDPKPDGDVDDDAEPVAWPGPALDRIDDPAPPEIGSTTVRGCTEVTGSDAADLFDAALENPLPIWDVDGDVSTIVVVALLPDEQACGTA